MEKTRKYHDRAKYRWFSRENVLNGGWQVVWQGRLRWGKWGWREHLWRSNSAVCYSWL